MAVPRGAAGMLGGSARAAINTMVERNNTEVVILSFAPARLLQFRCVRSEREPAFTGYRPLYQDLLQGRFVIPATARSTPEAGRLEYVTFLSQMGRCPDQTGSAMNAPRVQLSLYNTPWSIAMRPLFAPCLLAFVLLAGL